MWFSAKYKDGEVRDLKLDDYWTEEPIYRLKEQFRSVVRGYPISIKDEKNKEYIANSAADVKRLVKNALAARNAGAKSLDKYGSLCKQLQDIGREYRRLNRIVVKEIDALKGNDEKAYEDACKRFNAFSDLVPYHLSDGLVMRMNIPMK